MGLEVVLNQILAAGAKEESDLLEQAQFEREQVLGEARARADQVRRRGETHLQARAEALQREMMSAAEFEARRRILVARRELSENFRKRVLEAVAKLPDAKNQTLLLKLAERAKSELPKGVVHARQADLPTLTKAGFKPGRETTGAGGFQVESPDESVVLDFRYETLLENTWKELLSQHHSLFEV